MITPSIRFRIGRPPFAVSLNIPIMSIVEGVVGLLTQPQEQSQPATVAPATKALHILVHDGGEVDIPCSTEQEAMAAAVKTLKLVPLMNPKLCRAEGDKRILIGVITQ
jgi:hypothetical protein